MHKCIVYKRTYILGRLQTETQGGGEAQGERWKIRINAKK